MADQAQSALTLKTRPPALPANLINRPGLSGKLTTAALLPVTVISAGPGTGKTLTVASWVSTSASSSAVAWLSLDGSDNDLRVFWSDVIQALIASGGVPPDSPLGDIAPAAQFGPAEVIEVRSRLAALPVPITLVFDDFHEITDETVIATFNGLAEHVPSALRLVILSRTDPPLRLHRLRVAGQLAEIRSAELAFSARETTQMFQATGVELTADQVALLLERTEGWAAGLRLAALSLDPRDVDAGVRHFSGLDHPVVEYLTAEILARQTISDRDFLLRTSVVDRVSGPLATRLTGRTDAQAMLERLVRENAFVLELGGRSEWFTYHRMMREMLLHRLGLDQPEVKAGLHRAAAHWLVERGQPSAAIQQFILAEDFDGAGRTLLSAIPLIVSPDGPGLAAAIEPLARRANDSPSLHSLLAAATWHYQRKQYAAMRQDSVEARQYLDGAPDELKASAEVVLLLFEMVAARTQGDAAGVVHFASRAIDVLDGARRAQVPAARGFRVMAESNRTGALVWTGGAGVAERLLTAAEQAAELNLPLPHLNITSHLALLDVLHGRCRAAHERSQTALELAERRGWGSEPQALAAFLAQALVELARGRPDAAGSLVRRGLAAGGKETDRALRIALAITDVYVAIDRHDREAATIADARVVAGIARTPRAPESLIRWSAVAGADALMMAGRPEQALERISEMRPGGGFAAPRHRICLAQIRLQLGQPAAAEELIQPLLRPDSQYRESTVAAYLLRATIAENRRRDSGALGAITTAIEIAEAEEIIAPFLRADSGVAKLLQRYKLLGGRHDMFAGRLDSLMNPQRPATRDPQNAATLTDRELVVLQYLPTLLKSQDIADDLNVSVNTIKAHLRGIYQKLGTSTRREAVDRARTQRLL